MSTLQEILDTGIIQRITFGLSRSYVNTLKLLLVDKTFNLSQDNVSLVYEAAIKYYNAGFAKETGEILQPKNTIGDYVNLITLMFSEEFGREKTVASVNDINVQYVVTNYSLFSLYVLLSNYKNIRTAVWEDFETAGFEISTLFDVVYKTCISEINKSDNTSQPLSFDEWKRVAINIVWNVKKLWELSDS